MKRTKYLLLGAWAIFLLLPVVLSAQRIDILKKGSPTAVSAETPQISSAPLDEAQNIGYRTGVSDYRVGPGDTLHIVVWEHEDIGGDYAIDDKGSIYMPLVNEVPVQGKTVTEVKNLLTRAFSEYLLKPFILVQIKEYQSQVVTVIGEISPGSPIRGGVFKLRGPTKVSECIASFGGFSAEANQRAVKLIRKTGEILTINFETVLAGTEQEKDVLLKDGDIISIPSLKRSAVSKVTVLGEISPGSPVKGGVYNLERPTTILDAIASFGGFSVDADLKNIKVIKKSVDSSTPGEIITIDFNKIYSENKSADNIWLEDGETIVIPSLKKLIEQKKILMLGEVKAPGVYLFDKEPMLSEAIAKAGSWTDDAVLSKVMIIRGDYRRPQNQLRSDFASLLKKADLRQNLALKENDIVFIPRSGVGNMNYFLRQFMPSLQFIGWTTTSIANIDNMNRSDR